jgi:hypothetical protein
VLSVRSRRASFRPLLAATTVLAATAAAQPDSTPPDVDRAGWMLGLGGQVDEDDAESFLGTFYAGVGQRTWLTVAAGSMSSPGDRADIEADALLFGVDHRFETVGFTLEAERWGDSGVLETTDLSASVYFDRVRWRIGFGYENRDIEIPLTVTGPLGGTFSRTVDLSADGLSLDASVTLAERWRMYVGLKEFDYERNLNVLPRIASLNWLSASTLTLANSFLDHDRWLAVERTFGQATLLNVRFATDRSALDRSELDTLEAAVLFPVGRRFDLEVNVGSGRSDVFDTGLYGGLSFLIYGR